MEKGGCVYILASKPHGVLYIGVTARLSRRLHQHREGDGEGSKFCAKYYVHRLIHIEWFGDIRDAIHREKRLKKWNRQWKIDLIEKENPEWFDLYGRLGWE